MRLGVVAHEVAREGGKVRGRCAFVYGCARVCVRALVLA